MTQRPTENCRTSTPWGTAQHVSRYGRGVNFYGTASHGGFKVSKTLNIKIPEYMRAPDGWYEEDCEWAKVAVVFPERFATDEVEDAIKTLRNWDPDAYERFYDVVLLPGESAIKDERTYMAEHANDLLTTAAWGDCFEFVPKGYVLVSASVGGAREAAQRYFLVPASEYTGGAFKPFWVRPESHKETEIRPNGTPSLMGCRPVSG